MGLELGTILSLLRFDDGTLEREMLNLDSKEEQEDLKTDVNRLKSKYGITLKSPSTFIQTVNQEEFYKFIEEWRQAQGEEKIWNPDYAPPISVQSSVERFCRAREPAEVIKEFNLSGETEKIPRDYVRFPFDGWMLAHYLQLAYEK